MTKESIKILYCYDENNNEVYYRNTIKGNKYYCVDCGEELVVKDGKIKVKHLAHKNDSECSGTGESIFHKHWKTSMFKEGLFITVKGKQHEITKVLNEECLSKRYNKDWDREIIVDTLLETEDGDIVVEIHYTNPKEWIDLEKYYDTLDLLEVFEVDVTASINESNTWKTMLGIIKEEKRKIEKAKKNREEKRKKA